MANLFLCCLPAAAAGACLKIVEIPSFPPHREQREKILSTNLDHYPQRWHVSKKLKFFLFSTAMSREKILSTNLGYHPQRRGNYNKSDIRPVRKPHRAQTIAVMI
ncbi:MAG: hypothetical protein LBR79_00020 [Oscillospiraceae bacterium]|jgi:hypothetical protein|nr:hypothetical protein [Oscillospiraceae bacterium]